MMKHKNNGQLLNSVCIRIALFTPVILLDMLHEILGEKHHHLFGCHNVGYHGRYMGLSPQTFVTQCIANRRDSISDRVQLKH